MTHPPAPLDRSTFRGMVDEDLTHGHRGHRAEVRLVGVLGVGLLDHLEKRLMHERRCLERVIAPLSSEVIRSKLIEVVVHQREKLGGRGRVAGLQVARQLRCPVLCTHSASP